MEVAHRLAFDAFPDAALARERRVLALALTRPTHLPAAERRTFVGFTITEWAQRGPGRRFLDSRDAGSLGGTDRRLRGEHGARRHPRGQFRRAPRAWFEREMAVEFGQAGQCAAVGEDAGAWRGAGGGVDGVGSLCGGF